MVRHKIVNGGFACGDTETGNCAYAYPTSPHAAKVLRNPHKAESIAREMVRDANRVAPICYPRIVAEFNARIWREYLFFDCPLCGQHITDRLPCGCGARP